MYSSKTQQPAWPFPEKQLPAEGERRAVTEATKPKQPQHVGVTEESPFFAALYQPTSSSVKSWNLSTLFWPKGKTNTPRKRPSPPNRWRVSQHWEKG